MNLPWRYIIVSFAIGLVLGAALGLSGSRHLAHRWMKHSPEMFLRHLDHELHLRDSQKSQIRTMLEATRKKMADYQQQIRQTTRAEIRKLLTSDQQTRFDAMVARFDARRKTWEK